MSDWKPYRPTEFPDEAGYPDGMGVLDQGSAVGDGDVLDDDVRMTLRELDMPSVDADGEVEVHRLEEEHAYVATLDGVELARLRFSEKGGSTVLVRTTVPREFRGRGIAANLIADALDDLRTRGDKVEVECPVVAAFLNRNPEYRPPA